MIKCNLSVLLAERGLKMIDVVKDTGLSQNAVRGLYYNTSKGIQFETLEILCNYLKVKPGDVIKEIPFSYSITDHQILSEENAVRVLVNFNYDDQFYDYDVTVKTKNLNINELKQTLSSFEFYFDIIYSKELDRKVLSQLTSLELERFNDYLVRFFFDVYEIEHENHKVANVFHVTV